MSFKDKSTGQINPAFVPGEDEEKPGVQSLEKVGPAPEASSTPNMTYGPNESRRMLKNVFLTSFAFTFLFTAFQSMASLQSSINSDAGLGTYSLSVLYGSIVVSSMFLPTYLIRKFTVKWTLVFAVLGYSTYIAAQFEPSYATLIPGAVIVGFCAAPLWSSKCTYLTHVGHQYTKLTGASNAEVIIVRFFGVFFLFFQSSSIWGNLISSAVLSQDARECRNNISTTCGVNFCPDTEFCDKDFNSTSGVTPSTRYTLSGIYLACSLTAAVLLAVFLDPLTRYGEKERNGSSSQLEGKELLIATFRHMRKPYQILIIPLTIWSGMEQGFFGAEYTAGFVNCAWGIEKIGYVLICYGVVDAIGSISFGPIIRYTGRITIFVFGAIVNIAMIIVMLTWTPDPDNPIMFFVVAGCWGLGDAIWQTQINAFYGVLFPQDEEPSFSNYRLWESLGFIIAYVFSNILCVKIKLYILLAVIIVGMLGYFVIEILERKKSKKSSQ
ncbi:UNC93-like protein [Orchesella cincta]|uniref:UNC93-like protein n=1 Tax=Orchesella cincta TaxID=48709 RepID=A0A1D2NHD7_ORCCI|nr:UNC93-like protein [Orchesella cincta]